MARQIRKKSGTGIYHVIKERSALPLAPARTDPVIEDDCDERLRRLAPPLLASHFIFTLTYSHHVLQALYKGLEAREGE